MKKKTNRKRSTKKSAHIKRYERKKEELIYKVREINIPDFSQKYRISLNITGDLSQFKIPGFISSILSMGKIPIGTAEISARAVGNKKYELSIDFAPSPILSVLTKHEKFAYNSVVFFDEEKGFLTQRTLFIERKTDGREFKKEEDFSDEDEISKDPVALFLDLVSLDFSSISKKLKEEQNQDFGFEIRREDRKIYVYPKGSEFSDFISLVRIELLPLTQDFKIPKSFFVRGLLSLFDLSAEIV